MLFRPARMEDIAGMHRVRVAVNENRLSNPDRISPADYSNFISRRGKGWICELDGTIAGFSVIDMQDENVWALFVDPEYEGRGIGKQLQTIMLDWYFGQRFEKVWLGTAPGTRAEKFYRLTGWTEAGMHGPEVKFEMTRQAWERLRNEMR